MSRGFGDLSSGVANKKKSTIPDSSRTNYQKEKGQVENLSRFHPGTKVFKISKVDSSSTKNYIHFGPSLFWRSRRIYWLVQYQVVKIWLWTHLFWFQTPLVWVLTRLIQFWILLVWFWVFRNLQKDCLKDHSSLRS